METKSILKKALFISLFLLMPDLKSQTNYQEIMLQANKSYKESNFEQAFNLYKKIPNPSAQINYNL